MSEQQVISKQRVADHGEVYTHAREVNAMLDLVKSETERIESRFLEPACGTGNFLVEILNRKLAVVSARYAKSQLEWERYAVLAVSSIYGIDILADSVLALRRTFDIQPFGDIDIQLVHAERLDFIDAFGVMHQEMVSHKGVIHLMLTDVVMPGMNGKMLFETITHARPEMKVLFMSGYTENVIAERGVLKEGVNFIQKPFSIKELALKLGSILSQKDGNAIHP